MAINCCYFTSNKEYFSKHLSKHSLEDNYLRCSYCLFEADTEKKIIDHILILHAFDKYQCEHCFYRSVVPGNVLVHSQQYHKQNSHLVLVNLQDEINERQELKKIKATQMRFVKPMICLGELFLLK